MLTRRIVVPSSCEEHQARLSAYRIRVPLSIPQISLGEHRAIRLRDYGVTCHQASDLAMMSRWDYEGILDQARRDWHRATADQIRSDLEARRRFRDVEELATANCWGAHL